MRWIRAHRLHDCIEQGECAREYRRTQIEQRPRTIHRHNDSDGGRGQPVERDALQEEFGHIRLKCGWNSNTKLARVWLQDGQWISKCQSCEPASGLLFRAGYSASRYRTLCP